MDQTFLVLPIFAVFWGRIHLFFLFPGILQKEKKMETWGLEGKVQKAKIKAIKVPELTEPGECVRGQGRAVRAEAQAAVRLGEGLGLPPAELGRGSSSPTRMAPGVWGHREGG